MRTDEHKMTQLGYALREYRVRHNMTQQELADQLFRLLSGEMVRPPET